MKSLRGRLLAGTTLTCAAVFLLLGVALDLFARRELLGEFDDALRAKAAAIASMVEWHGRRTVFDQNAAAMWEFAARQNPEYFQVWLAGKPFVRSPSLDQSDLSTLPPADAAVRWTTLPDGRRGRLLTMTFLPVVEERDDDRRNAGAAPPEPPPAALAVAKGSEDLDRTLADLRWTMCGLSAAGLVLLAGVLAVLIHRATASVNRLSRAIAAVDASNAAARLQVAGLPNELAPVVERLNELLQRLADALDRERAFTADVAHELRTPLAGIRATLEVCRTRPRDPAAYETAIDRSMTMLLQMQSMVQNMLMLARAEGGDLSHEAALVDPAELLKTAWRMLEDQARERRIDAHWQIDDRLAVRADEQLLRMVLRNLLENAVTYAPPGTTVDITTEPDGPDARLAITNDAPALAPADLPRLFDRFWRKDSSRTQPALHAGLGLSLCRRLTHLMDGQISADLTPPTPTTPPRLTLSLHLQPLPLPTATTIP
ncbi:MAG TPA: ATP-binding protein [Phycisphaerae bacterium]|nr:ATP-binding protein [Phycisphaerae bacterium]